MKIDLLVYLSYWFAEVFTDWLNVYLCYLWAKPQKKTQFLAVS